MPRNQRINSITSRDSFRLNSRRRSRTASILRRRSPKVACRCFAGQIHIKIFLIGVQVLFLAVGCAGLLLTSASFDTILFATNHTASNGTAYAKPALYRSLISTYSMNLVISVVSCASGLYLMKKFELRERTEEGRMKLPICVPSLLLLPLLFSEIILLAPFAMWASFTIRMQLREFLASDSTFMAAIDAIRFALVPIIVVWTLLCYIIYNTFVSYTFVWRQTSRTVTFSQSLFNVQGADEEPTMNCSIQDFPPPSTAFVKRSPTSPARASHKLHNSLDTAHARKFRNLKDMNISLESVDETVESPLARDMKLLSPSRNGRLNSSFSSLNILPTVHESQEPSSPPQARNKEHEETVELRRIDPTLEGKENEPIS
ncbi:unnamed protein product, partial [Mesorhabditis belari]|uniref:Uncharacterized protein n=1 Tax=Mesorhabditis belari TaxID=2138241 RepID=A0AAF3FCG0_9BILA